MLETLENYFDDLSYLTGVPYNLWVFDGSVWRRNSDQKNNGDFQSDRFISKEIIEVIQTKDKPIVISDDEMIFFGICKCDDRMKVIIGPISVVELSLKEKSQLKKRYHIQLESNEIRFPIKTLFYLVRALSHVYQKYFGERVTVQDAFCYDVKNKSLKEISYEYRSHTIGNVEENKENLAYRHILRLKELIALGDCDVLFKEMNILGNGYYGDFTASTFKRHEYMAVTSVAIHAQAVVEGGISSSVAYDMSDIYLRRIELCKTVDDIIQIQIAISKGYINILKEHNNQQSNNNYVEKIKKYVIRHITTSISLEDIANDTQLDKYYLSRLFYKKEGTHLHDYIHKERINAASNMLKFSDVSLVDIANYFSFSSQSYFCVVFKKYQGVTPKKYRDQHQMVDFIEKRTRQ